MNAIAIDIETAPLPNAAELFDPADVKVGNLKDEAKIKAKIDAAREEFTSKAALNWTTGQITCIGMFNDDLSVAFHPGNGDNGMTERDMLEAFWGNWAHHQIITYNGYSFDMQFICMRSMVHGISAPFLRARGSKYLRTLEDKHIDLINVFDNGGTWQGMGKVCKALLGEEKTGSGLDAITYFQEGEYDKLAAYCLKDCELTWNLWKLVRGEA